MKYSKAWSVVAPILKNGLGGDRKGSDWHLWCGASAWQRCGLRVISSKLGPYLLSGQKTFFPIFKTYMRFGSGTAMIWFLNSVD